MKPIQQQRINKQIAKMSPTTGSLIHMHDREIERHDRETAPSYQITHTKLTLKQLSERMSGKYRWITTSADPATGAQLVKSRNHKLTNDKIMQMYSTRQLITFKAQGEYVTWIK